jgi:hypothetical protein
MLGGQGMDVGLHDAQTLGVGAVFGDVTAGDLLNVWPSSRAFPIILSSMSVKFCTKVTAYPRQSKIAAQHVEDHQRPGVSRWMRLYTVGPQT